MSARLRVCVDCGRGLGRAARCPCGGWGRPVEAAAESLPSSNEGRKRVCCGVCGKWRMYAPGRSWRVVRLARPMAYGGQIYPRAELVCWRHVMREV